jgi:hypothetical protein
MRATISFDIDLGKVEDTMAALIGQQSDALRVAANILSNPGSETLLEELTSAIGLVEETATQLHQYRNMLVNFERAKYETVLPQAANQSVANVGQAVDSLNKFGDFIDRINSQQDENEGTNDAEPAPEG